MDIQKHGFYIGLGAVLLLYLGAYFIAVTPYNKKIKRSTRKLRKTRSSIKKYLKQKDSLPNDRVIGAHQKRKDELIRARKKALKFFEDKDKNIERWFDSIKKELNGPDDVPKLDFFQVVYDKETQRVIEKYADRTSDELMKIGARDDSFEAIVQTPKEKQNIVRGILPFVSSQDILTESKMREVQKQFWVIEGFLDVLEKGKLKNLKAFKFTSRWGNEQTKKFNKYAIEIVGDIEYQNIALLVNNILTNPHFMTDIEKINVSRDNTYKPKQITVPVKWGQTEKEALKQFMKDNKSKAKLPLVKISTKFYIYDYNPKGELSLKTKKKRRR